MGKNSAAVKSEKIWHCICHEARGMRHGAGNKQPGNRRSRIIQNMHGTAATPATSAATATEVVIYSLFTLE